MPVQGGGPVVYTPSCKMVGKSSDPGLMFFLHFFLSLVLLSKLGFHAQTKPARRR